METVRAGAESLSACRAAHSSLRGADTRPSPCRHRGLGALAARPERV